MAFVPPPSTGATGDMPWFGIVIFVLAAYLFWLQFQGRYAEWWRALWYLHLRPLAAHFAADVRAIKQHILWEGQLKFLVIVVVVVIVVLLLR
jgi:hypothetical protein